MDLFSQRPPRALSHGPGDPNDAARLLELEQLERWKPSPATSSRVQVAANARMGSYFFMDSNNPTLDRVVVGVVGGVVVAGLSALVFAGNPFAIVGFGVVSGLLLYGLGSPSSTFT